MTRSDASLSATSPTTPVAPGVFESSTRPLESDLFFRCDVAGIRSETRAAFSPLESLDDERLVDLLQSGAE